MPLQSRPVPARAGIGLRAPHHEEFLATRPDVPWVEVHSENFFADGGPQVAVLDTVRRDYGVSLHGVGLSVGSSDPLDSAHLARLKRLVDRIEPALVSEHVSWSSIDGDFLNDLLPIPATREALEHVVSRVGQVQEALGRQILSRTCRATCASVATRCRSGSSSRRSHAVRDVSSCST